jgi:hypothetical protein
MSFIYENIVVKGVAALVGVKEEEQAADITGRTENPDPVDQDSNLNPDVGAHILSLKGQ